MDKNLKKVILRIWLATLASFTVVTSSVASLDLLAGVEAGIETHTAMSTADLNETQTALSTKTSDKPYTWRNDFTGTTYKIVVDHHYTYGQYPCVAYDLVIEQNNHNEIKSLDACKNSTGQWISVTPASSAL
jgi:surface antigen